MSEIHLHTHIRCSQSTEDHKDGLWLSEAGAAECRKQDGAVGTRGDMCICDLGAALLPSVFPPGSASGSSVVRCYVTVESGVEICDRHDVTITRL